MTTAFVTVRIGSPADTARARTVAARLMAAAGVPVPDRGRLMTALGAQLWDCLGKGGTWELVIATRRPAGEHEGYVTLALRPAGRPSAGRRHRSGQRRGDRQPQAQTVWRQTLAAARPVQPAGIGAVVPVADGVAKDIPTGTEDMAAVLERLDDREKLVGLYREELHQTNQGVLALHAELDAAALAQRKLLDAERNARTEAENARHLLTFLAESSAAVTASLDSEDILRRLPELLVPEYASDVDVWLFDEDETATPRGERRATARGGRPAAAVAAARTGRPQHSAAHPGRLPGVSDHPASVLFPDQPLLCIPITAHRMLGVLTLAAPGPRFDPDTSVMLMELVRRAAVALDNALRYQQHRDVAEALQHAQLTELPTAEGLSLAARYLPATRGLNIGGDWYDAFPQPDGSLIAVVGDVTGHGLRAAVMMGQLRTALRAYAIDGDSPGRILTRLHAMLLHQQPELYATAVIARFRHGDPVVVWASAGHPPAVVRAPDGTVHVPQAKPGVMLGVPVPFTYEDHTVGMPPGSTLALYTDGLVERRTLGIDPGIERLAESLGALGTANLKQDLDTSAESLLTTMLQDSERDDDVCLLLCHTTEAPTDGPDGAPTDARAKRPARGAPARRRGSAA